MWEAPSRDEVLPAGAGGTGLASEEAGRKTNQIEEAAMAMVRGTTPLSSRVQAALVFALCFGAMALAVALVGHLLA